jgi:hypothetical protein
MADDVDGNEDRRSSRVKWVFVGFAIIAALFLLTEHRAHVLPYLPWLILLACPFMHMFMHHGHGGHGGHGGRGGHQGGDDPPGGGVAGTSATKPDGLPGDGTKATRGEGHSHHGGSL